MEKTHVLTQTKIQESHRNIRAALCAQGVGLRVIHTGTDRSPMYGRMKTIPRLLRAEPVFVMKNLPLTTRSSRFKVAPEEEVSDPLEAGRYWCYRLGFWTIVPEINSGTAIAEMRTASIAVEAVAEVSTVYLKWLSTLPTYWRPSRVSVIRWIPQTEERAVRREAKRCSRISVDSPA